MGLAQAEERIKFETLQGHIGSPFVVGSRCIDKEVGWLIWSDLCFLCLWFLVVLSCQRGHLERAFKAYSQVNETIMIFVNCKEENNV